MRRMILLLLLTPLVAGAYEYVGKTNLVRVVDGDTVVLDVEIYKGLTKRVSVRLDGVDTPETRTSQACQKELGMAAKSFTKNFLKDKSLELTVYETDSFGRAIGNVIADGYPLSDALLKAGHARVYQQGQTGKGWCQ